MLTLKTTAAAVAMLAFIGVVPSFGGAIRSDFTKQDLIDHFLYFTEALEVKAELAEKECKQATGKRVDVCIFVDGEHSEMIVMSDTQSSEVTGVMLTMLPGTPSEDYVANFAALVYSFDDKFEQSELQQLWTETFFEAIGKRSENGTATQTVRGISYSIAVQPNDAVLFGVTDGSSD